MILFLIIFCHQQISLFAINRSVIFIGPVHTIENQNEKFSCFFNSKEEFQTIQVDFKNDILTSTSGDEKCAVSKDFRKYITYCNVEYGILNFTMMFITQFEGIFTCKIITKNGENFEGKMNTFVNASSPIFSGIIKDGYYENETLSFSCQSINNKTNLLIINYLVYSNGEMINLSQMNTTLLSITNTSINLNKTMHEGFLGCGIQYEYSRYNENFIKLNIYYEIENIEIYPNKEIYYGNDTIRCYANGNPSSDVAWNLYNQSNNYDDVINGSSLIIGYLLGNRTYRCTAKQFFGNKTVILAKEFIFVVKLFQTTITSTPKWTNVEIKFTGDQFFKLNISEHRWEISPKWVGFINGTITVNGSEIISFNNTNIFKYPDYVYDINITISGLFYRLTESAAYGEYHCKMLNQYQETIKKTIFFIKGENPSITMVRDGNKFIINCSTTTLGLPPGSLRFLKRNLENTLENFAPDNYSMFYIIKEAYFDWKDNGHVIFCVNKNEFYSWESEKLKINILFPVRNIKLSPNLDEYKYGDTVKCDAIGNPEPNITWWSNANSSYIIGSSSNIITLTPPSKSNVFYICVASNVIDNETNMITKVIHINGSDDGIVYFSVVPNVVGLVEHVAVNCSVDKINKVSLINIKDNDDIMVSVESSIFQITKNYRNKIYNRTINERSVTFGLDLSNASPRNLSCYVVYLSNNRSEKRVELKNTMEIEYLTRTPIVGKTFRFSCLQNYQNSSIIKAGILIGNENVTLQTIENVKIGELKYIDIEIENRFINNSFFCSLIFNGKTIKTVIGDTLIERFGLWEIFISPNLTKYEVGMTVKCDATGNPLPDISWSSNANNSFSIVSIPNVIQLTAIADANVIYTCNAINTLNNVTNILNKSINIYGKYEEFINFEVIPKVVGLSENVSVMCEVDKFSSVSIMNIKDNDNIMISISSETPSIHLNYHSKITNLNKTSKSIKFEMNLSKENPRNMSCFVIFVSNNRSEKSIFLGKPIEIMYENGHVIKDGEFLNISCIQRVKNNLWISANSMENNNISFPKFLSNVSFPIYFTFLINNSLHGSQFYCSLFDNISEIAQSTGKELYVVYLSNEIKFLPNKTDYSKTDKIICNVEGRPSPTIRWIEMSESKDITIENNILVLSKAMGEYQYNCSAETRYNEEILSISKNIQFRVLNSNTKLMYLWPLVMATVFLILFH